MISDRGIPCVVMSILNGLHECWRFNGELGRHVHGHSILSYPILRFQPRWLHCLKLTGPHPVNEGQAQHLFAPILIHCGRSPFDVDPDRAIYAPFFRDISKAHLRQIF